MTLQELTDKFNTIYVEATRTSNPQSWLNAALLGRQIVDQLNEEQLIVDTFFEELSKQEGE